MSSRSRLPSIAVAGAGRCGSSLTLQMLHAAGVAVVGRPPAFEVERARCPRGRAVKWLEPGRFPCPFSPGDKVLGIYLTRDPEQQGASMVKMLRDFGAPIDETGEAVDRLTESLRPKSIDRARVALSWWGPVYDLTFEELVGDPVRTTFRLAAWLSRHGRWDLDEDRAAAMPSALLPRSTGAACMPDLSIESALLRRYGV